MSDQFQIKTISPVHFPSMAYKSVYLSTQHQKKKSLKPKNIKATTVNSSSLNRDENIGKNQGENNIRSLWK